MNANTYYSEILKDKYYFLGADASRGIPPTTDSSVKTVLDSNISYETPVIPISITIPVVPPKSDPLPHFEVIDSGVRYDNTTPTPVVNDTTNDDTATYSDEAVGTDEYSTNGGGSGGGGSTIQNTDSDVAIVDAVIPFYKKPMVIGGTVLGIIVVGFLAKKYVFKK